MNKVLQSFAWAMDSETCTARHYELSIRVNYLDTFISHNWSTPRSDKFWALALHYNSLAASCTAGLAAGTAFILSATGVLPMLVRDTGKRGIWCQVFGLAGFFFGLVFAADIAVFCRRRLRNHVVFLDRTCVCQTDAELKRRGIQHLAAFLARSCSMLVLYSDIYLQKLWTVYELATYLLLFPEGHLVFQPTFFPKVVITGMLVVTFSRANFCIYGLDGVHDALIRFGISSQTVQEFLWMAMTAPSIIFLTIMLRLWASESAKIQDRLQQFSIQNATCFEEGDRRLIEDSVSVFVKHVGLIESGADHSDALAAFDGMIHREVPRLFMQRVGRTGIPYHYVVVMYMIYIFYAFDAWAGFIRDGKAQPTRVVSFVLYCAGVALSAGPLTVALCFGLSRKLQGIGGVILTGFATFAVYNFLLWLYWELASKAFNSPAYLAVSGVVICTVLMMTCIVYRPIAGVPENDGKSSGGPPSKSGVPLGSGSETSDVVMWSDYDERGSATEDCTE